jgi:hypothetical protein
VRTCDGYYFPISFAARGEELRRDANACRALCPGQDVAIYLQRNPGGEGGPMVSLSGEPYTALSTAFRYRSEYDRGCTCGPIDARIAAAFQAFAVPLPSQGVAHPMKAGDRMIPRPPRPNPRQLVGETVYREGPNGKMVRLVGPAGSFPAE